MLLDCKKLVAILLITILPLTYTKYVESKYNKVASESSFDEPLVDEEFLSAQAPAEFFDPVEGSGDIWDIESPSAPNQRILRAVQIPENSVEERLLKIFIMGNSEKFFSDKGESDRNLKLRSVNDKTRGESHHNNLIPDRSDKTNATNVTVNTRFSLLDVPPNCQSGYIAVGGRCRKLA